MRIGINEVIIYDRSSGARGRELAILPELLSEITTHDYTGIVYVSRDLSEEIIHQLTGHSKYPNLVRTPIPSIPTYQRILLGLPYWRDRVSKDRLDIFHTAYYPLPALKIPTVLTIHDLRFVHFPETYQRWRRIFLRTMVGPSLHRATRIIAVSQDTKNDAVKHFNISEKKIDVVHNSIDPRFQTITDDSVLRHVRDKYSLPKRFILYVGHLEPRKNLERLLLAFLQLRKEQKIPHKLVVLGKPEFLFETLLNSVAEKHLNDQVLFTGYAEDEDMPAIYSLADLLAFPSLHEGFGVPVIEAMACGTPVVTSDSSALPEVAGNAAVLVDPYSVGAIAAGIQKVLRDPVLYADLVRMGLERVKEFSAQASATAILETYQKALGGSR